MSEEISMLRLIQIIKGSIIIRIPDVIDEEIEAFVSGLYSSIGLAATHLAFSRVESREGVAVFTCNSNKVLDFHELSRSDLLKNIEACCG